MDRLLENDLAAKIISVLLAVTLWFQVSGQGYEAQKSVGAVSVRVRNLPPGLEAVALEPDVVTVTVRGPRREVARVTRADFEAGVNLAGARPGRTTYLLDGVSVPPGITLVGFQPAQVTVTVEAVQEQEATVRVRLQGRPAEGYVAGAPSVDPPRVVLRGTSRVLGRVAAVEVPVRVDGLQGDVRERRPVAVLDSQGLPVDGVTVSPQRVTVAVPVSPAEVAKQVPVRPAVAGEPARGFAVMGVEVAPDAVSVTGTAEALAGVTEAATEPVDVSGARGDVRRRVALRLPEGVRAAGDGSVDVAVRIARPR